MDVAFEDVDGFGIALSMEDVVLLLPIILLMVILHERLQEQHIDHYIVHELLTLLHNAFVNRQLFQISEFIVIHHS